MERIIVTNKGEMEGAVLRASEVLECGGLILYPTDTLYGIGVDATNENAIAKVFNLKGRDDGKPLSVMLAGLDMAKKYVELSSFGESLIKKILPGPFTIVLPRKNSLPEILTGGGLTLGLRIPDLDFCLSLTKKFAKPITSTSANISGTTNQTNIDEILEQLGDKKGMIDLVIDVGELVKRDPSTVLKVDGTSVEVLREGNINHTVMLNVTKEE